MTLRRRLMLWVGFAVAVVACASAPRPKPAEQLYFAMEVSQSGRVIARPKLLGEAGKVVRAERRQPGADQADYQLVLDPATSGGGYRIKLDLALPDGQGHSELALLHGEQRRVELGLHPGDLEVSLMVMRVDSPEFRALMDIAQRSEHVPNSI